MGGHAGECITGGAARRRWAVCWIDGPIGHASERHHRRRFVDFDGDDIARNAGVAGPVGDGLCRRSDRGAFAAQHLVGRATYHPGQGIGTGEADRDIAIVPAVGIGGAGRRRTDRRGGLINPNCDHIAGGAAVARQIRNGLRRRSDATALVAQYLVGGAACYTGQIIGTGEANGDIVVEPTVRIG